MDGGMEAERGSWFDSMQRDGLIFRRCTRIYHAARGMLGYFLCLPAFTFVNSSEEPCLELERHNGCCAANEAYPLPRPSGRDSSPTRRRLIANGIGVVSNARRSTLHRYLA